MPNTLKVFSPVDGAVVPLEQVPDPVFSEHMLGDGIAVDPANDTVFAPFDGKIINFNKASHALVLGRDGVEVLIHVGLETVSLKGEGFTPLAKAGDSVTLGQPLLKFSQEVLAQKAASPFVMVVVTAPADAPALQKADGLVKAGQPLFEVAAGGASAAADAQETFTESSPITVINPNGLHARPAAVLAQLAMAHPFTVQLVKDGHAADAKSIVGIMGMALCAGDTITVRAAGPADQAKAALAKIEAGFKEGFGEKDAVSAPSAAPETAAEDAPADFSNPVRLSGLSACGGLAQGKAFLFQTEDAAFEENASDPQAERRLLDETLRALTAETEAKIAAEKSDAAKDILSAHLGILKDPVLLNTAQEAISRGKSAAYGVNEAVRYSIDVLKKTNNRFLMERIADLKDLRRALLLRLSGGQQAAPEIPAGCILLADELLPSEVSAFDGRVAGVLLAQGSPTAHASIMLRNMGIPSVVRAGQNVLSVPAGAAVCLDGDAAAAFVNPDEQQCQAFAARLEQSRQERAKQQAAAQDAAATQDGVRIWVEGNVSNEKEAALAAQNGADGLGLVRTEFLFHGRAQAPSEAEQQAAYQAVLDAAGGTTVTFRTLDAGGDKPLPFVDIPAEENPIVGIRGVRAFKRNEAFFRTQIRAMLSVTPADRARIMLPMIAFADEVDFFKKIIAEEKAALGVTADVKVGIMVEVPSAALTSEQMARRADFFSVGTNDLTQYTLAIDRGHKELSALSDHLHPAVLKLIEMTCAGAKKHHKPVAVCGAMAGDLAAVPFLIGLGVTELAVGAGAVAEVKALVRRLDAKKCAAAAQAAVGLASAQEVRALARKEFAV